MTLHTDWTDAKKDSKTRFKTAHKTKKAELEKKIKSGDAKAKAKMLDEVLAESGIEKGDDLDKYFTFKEDFGPTLDKFEKAKLANAAIAQGVGKLKTVEQVIADGKASKAMGAFAKRSGMEDFWLFVNGGYKADPVKAYTLFIKAGAPMEINVDGEFTQPLRAIGDNPAQLKAQGPALLKKCRDELIDIVGQDAMMKFTKSDECKALFGAPADLTATKKKLVDTIASYRQQIKSYDAKWKHITPDFRQPLLDAMTHIETALTA